MYAINHLTDDAFQTTTLQMPDGSTATLNLYYRASTPRWFFDFVHPTLPPAGAVNGQGLVAHPNMLRAWRRIVAFGFACVTSDGQDPVGPSDFLTGYATLYVLDVTDVLTVEAQVFNDVLAQAQLAGAA